MESIQLERSGSSSMKLGHFLEKRREGNENVTQEKESERIRKEDKREHRNKEAGRWVIGRREGKSWE